MADRILSGDKVEVIHIEGTYIATVIHTPGGAGDLWQVECDSGAVLALNPYCSKFVGFKKLVDTISTNT